MAEAINSHTTTSGSAGGHALDNKGPISELSTGETQEHHSDTASKGGDHGHHDKQSKHPEGERK